MPKLACLYLRAAIGFLVLGVLTGLHMSSAKNLGAGGFHWGYLVAHAHLLLIGFVLMAIMGACVWLLPAPPAKSRHLPFVDRAAYWVTLLSTLTRFTLEVVGGYHEDIVLSVLVFLVSIAQAAAILAFFLNQLPRIHAGSDGGAPAPRDDGPGPGRDG